MYELISSRALEAVMVDRCRRTRRENLLDFVAHLTQAS